MASPTEPQYTVSLGPYALAVNANIKAECARQGVSVVTLARHFNVSTDSISRRRTGQTAWTLDEIEGVASLLGVEPSDLADVGWFL